MIETKGCVYYRNFSSLHLWDLKSEITMVTKWIRYDSEFECFCLSVPRNLKICLLLWLLRPCAGSMVRQLLNQDCAWHLLTWRSRGLNLHLIKSEVDEWFIHKNSMRSVSRLIKLSGLIKCFVNFVSCMADQCLPVKNWALLVQQRYSCTNTFLQKNVLFTFLKWLTIRLAASTFCERISEWLRISPLTYLCSLHWHERCKNIF